MKRKIKFKDYKKCLQNNKAISTSQQRFKIEMRTAFT